MKHIFIFSSLFLASLSVHAVCPDEQNYLAPAELQPQCESVSSSDIQSSDAQLEDAYTSPDSTETVTPAVQASTEPK